MAVQIEGLDKLTRRLHAITDTRSLLAKLQLDTTAEAKRLVPRKTGNLGRSIAPGALSRTEALVVARARYAAYVELGTKPHVIRASRAQALRFPAPGVGKTLAGRVRTGELRRLGTGAYVFAQRVNHPGTKPQPFLLPGAKKAASGNNLPNLIIELWNKAA